MNLKRILNIKVLKIHATTTIFDLYRIYEILAKNPKPHKISVRYFCFGFSSVEDLKTLNIPSLLLI